MSEMSLEVVLRSPQTNNNIFEICNNIKKNENVEGQDLYLEDDNDEKSINYFLFSYKNESFRCIKINNEIFVDIILKDESSAYEVDESISFSQFNGYRNLMGELNLDIAEISFRILYYYNGGCAGLSEII